MPQIPPSDVTNDEAKSILSKYQPILEANLGIGIFAPDEVRPLPRLSTGIVVVDYILGGGLPKGMITEVYGPEGTGKSTFAAQVVKYNQDLDPNFRALMLDFEQTMTKEYLQSLGLDVDMPRLILSQPNTIEEGAILVKSLVPRGLVHMVVWDTPAASQPAALVNSPLTFVEGAKQNSVIAAAMKDVDAGKSSTGSIGLHARVFTHEIAGLLPHIAASGVVFLVPNQLRTTINTWGAGETTPGGRGLKFNAAIRIRLSKTETTKETIDDPILGRGSGAIGQLVNFRTIKNKTAPQERNVVVQLQYGKGFLDMATTLDLAAKRGIVKKAGGGNFELPDGVKIRGTEYVLQHWRDHPESYDKVKMAMLDIPLQAASDLAPETPAPREEFGDGLDEDDAAVDVPEGKVTI